VVDPARPHAGALRALAGKRERQQANAPFGLRTTAPGEAPGELDSPGLVLVTPGNSKERRRLTLNGTT
jgi:hypothetical protein